MSALAISLFIGTHFLALVLGMIVLSLVLEREDRIAEAKAEAVADPDLMALADIFIPRK